MEKLSGVPSGFEPFVFQKLLKDKGVLVHVAQNEKRLRFLADLIHTLMPKQKLLVLPAWDTVPYDRTAPSPEILGTQIDTLTELVHGVKDTIVLTSVAAWSQLLPPKDFFKGTALSLKVGQSVAFDDILKFLNDNGYQNTDVVMEMGEYAVRGGLLDIFAAGMETPVRLDFFGDEIDSIKTFDPVSQRTLNKVDSFAIKPNRLFKITPESQELFRSRYRDLFGEVRDDAIYQAVSEGRYLQGMEHFLPLFYEKMSHLTDYLPEATYTFDPQFYQSLAARETQIQDYYDARKQALKDKNLNKSKYYPIPKELFFINKNQSDKLICSSDAFILTPFQDVGAKDQGAHAGRDFVDVRVKNDQDIFEAVADFVRSCAKKVIVTAVTGGAGQRILAQLKEKNLFLSEVDSWKEALKHAPSLFVAPFESGFQTDDFVVITEADMFGERIQRPIKKKRAENFIQDVSTLSVGDLVVHQVHGIGQFAGLVPLQFDGAAHDCLCILYAGNDKLFVPVENADILSRYGSGEVALDHLGSQSFANKKERVKKDLFAMADKLLDIASHRVLNKVDRILAPHGLYQEFCARFPYTETDDQLRTIQEIETDLAKGTPMDRLVCGDVGFGKTEVAMRAAFLTVLSGKQVAVVAPTTLLARQHAQNFIERFQGFPVRIDSLSRLVSSSHAKKVKEELEKGTLDVVIGTHAVLSKTVKFKNLGLVVVDEEQHFGVAHKERLKELKTGVHVLTLTATPIPRTLQLSLSGVRELSVIATPPVDRLAVKTYVMPFDPVVIKEAILREHFRGGQTFFVVPRITDMPEVADILKAILPDIKVVQAHGQMAANQLEKIMTDFAEKKFDVLLATSIIESGLDMSSVNTIIVYRADMFGLAALYQLRGRVGRGKIKAYAYLTTPMEQTLSENAHKRLEVIGRLDSLGAGFALASHDLDIRGAGNLLGDDQSGHIREIGVALYQKMLAEAVATLRAEKAGDKEPQQQDFSPQISVGLPVLIPDTYIADLDVRMDLYHRMSELLTTAEIESMRAELIDRFGQYPVETDNLFITLELKILAKQANIERIDAGEKGATVSFFNNTFPNPAGLIKYIQGQLGTMKLRPDQKLIVMRPWGNVETRLKGVRDMIQKFAELAKTN